MGFESRNGCITAPPDWYWVRGLHDAAILSVTELTLPPDWKAQELRYNCLEIALDAKGALFDTGVRVIRLYNYQILTPETDLNELMRPWWITDRLVALPEEEAKRGKRYLLEITAEAAHGDTRVLAVRFAEAEVERKHP